MKTLEELSKLGTIEGFHAVKFMREQRNKLDALFAKMTDEEIIAYYNNVDERWRFDDHKEAKPYFVEKEQALVAAESEFEYETKNHKSKKSFMNK